MSELPYKNLQELKDQRDKFYKDSYRQWAAEEYYYKLKGINNVGNPLIPDYTYKITAFMSSDQYKLLIETLEKVLL